MDLISWIRVAAAVGAGIFIIVAILIVALRFVRNPNPSVSRREQRAIVKAMKSSPEDFVEVGPPLEPRSGLDELYEAFAQAARPSMPVGRVKPSIRSIPVSRYTHHLSIYPNIRVKGHAQDLTVRIRVRRGH